MEDAVTMANTDTGDPAEKGDEYESLKITIEEESDELDEHGDGDEGGREGQMETSGSVATGTRGEAETPQIELHLDTQTWRMDGMTTRPSKTWIWHRDPVAETKMMDTWQT